MTMPKRRDRDETYILDLCDQVLGQIASRQHRFDFLRGDPGKKGKGSKLPVDAYYEALKLVIEYRERQHSEPVKFFDKPNKLTISGIPRNEQRAKYDQRRRDVLTQNGLDLVELAYDDFEYDARKRLKRNRSQDIGKVRAKLARYL